MIELGGNTACVLDLACEIIVFTNHCCSVLDSNCLIVNFVGGTFSNWVDGV